MFSSATMLLQTSTLSKGTLTENMAATQATKRRKMFLWNIMGWVLVFAAISSMFLTIVILGFYLHLKPILPSVMVTKMSYLSWSCLPLNQSMIDKQQKTGNGNYYAATLSYKKLYTMRYDNPNSKLSVDVEFVDLKSYYSGIFTGHAERTGWLASPKSQLTFTMLIDQVELPLRKTVAATLLYDLARHNVDSTSDIRIRSRFRIFGAPVFWTRTRCMFKSNGGVTIEQRCLKVVS